MSDVSADYKQVLDRLEFLLRNVGAPGVCNGPRCGAPVLWVIYVNGRRSPYNANGEPHWATCPDREFFREQAKEKRKHAIIPKPAAG